MAGMNAHKAISVDAGADLSALQFTAVKMGTNRVAVSATDASEAILGILLNKPTSGQAAEVAISGQGKATAGGTISSGDKVTATTGGKLITTTTDHNHYIGMALSDAVANDLFDLNIAPGMVSL